MMLMRRLIGLVGLLLVEQHLRGEPDHACDLLLAEAAFEQRGAPRWRGPADSSQFEKPRAPRTASCRCGRSG
jgi:hypothetical protein